jgi:GNAT superfamily N-acetyltransferase
MTTLTFRNDGLPRDVEAVIGLHASLYAAEFGFDDSFLDHVSEPLRSFAANPSPRSRLWVAERDGCAVGSIAIVEHEPMVARLRWFLVDPVARGHGLGRELLREAIQFSKDSGYTSIILWTVSQLTVAAKLYRDAGFRRVLHQPGRMGGVEVVEEMYELNPIP